MNEFVLVFFVAMLSTLSQSITGFGFAIIMMSILTIFLPSDTSSILSLLFGGGIAAGLFVKYRKHFDLKLALFPALFTAIGIVIGLFIQAQTSSTIFLRMFGGFLILLSLWFFFYADKVKIKANFGSGAVTGLIAGVIGAMFTIAGPPLVLYFNTVTKKKETYMAVLQFSFAILSIITILGRVFIGKWPQDVTSYLLPASLGMIAGIIPGIWIYKKVNDDVLKKIVYIVMIASGIYYLITA
jgi:uncharacterized protein